MTFISQNRFGLNNFLSFRQPQLNTFDFFPGFTPNRTSAFQTSQSFSSGSFLLLILSQLLGLNAGFFGQSLFSPKPFHSNPPPAPPQPVPVDPTPAPDNSSINQNGQLNATALGNYIQSFDPAAPSTFTLSDLQVAIDNEADPTVKQGLSSLKNWLHNNPSHTLTQDDLNKLAQAQNNDNLISQADIDNLPTILGWSGTIVPPSESRPPTGNEHVLGLTGYYNIRKNDQLDAEALGKYILFLDQDHNATTITSSDLEAATHLPTGNHVDPLIQESLNKMDYWVRTDNHTLTQADLNKLAQSQGNDNLLNLTDIENLPTILGWS